MTQTGRAIVIGGAMLALFVLAIVVFILPFAFPTPPPIVTRFAATALFSPNGDGARDVARISVRLREASAVTLEVQRSGQTVRRLMDGERHQPGWVRLSWNGRDDDGQPLADGSYALKLRVRSGQKRFNTTRRIVIDSEAPAVVVVSSRSVPAPPRSQCVTSVETIDDAQARIEVSPAGGGELVRTLGPRPVRPGEPLRWSWDGAAQDGGPVAPGLYRMEVTVSDVARNRATVQRSCWIGQLVGRAVPERPRSGQRVGVALREPSGRAVAPGAGTRLSVHRRSGTPGADLGPPIGARVTGPVTGRAARVTVPIPSGARLADLWLVARSSGGVALIPLTP